MSSSIPKPNDVFFDGKEHVILFVHHKSNQFWVRGDFSPFYFEEVIQDTNNPNRWILNWINDQINQNI